MAEFPTITDRLVATPNRVKLTEANSGTELGTYDVTAVPGAITELGTPINNSLFEDIKEYIDATPGAGSNYYGTSTTATNVINKTVTAPAMQTLAVGNSVLVTFANDNTAQTVSLNVNGTGNVPVSRNGSTAISVGMIPQAIPIRFTYDGNSWVMEDIQPFISLNGVEQRVSGLYAPTNAGDSGKILTSSGNGEPVWDNLQIITINDTSLFTSNYMTTTALRAYIVGGRICQLFIQGITTSALTAGTIYNPFGNFNEIFRPVSPTSGTGLGTGFVNRYDNTMQYRSVYAVNNNANIYFSMTYILLNAYNG